MEVLRTIEDKFNPYTWSEGHDWNQNELPEANFNDDSVSGESDVKFFSIKSLQRVHSDWWFFSLHRF